ncbi:hypothetical protein Tco_0577941 [Tanacetum coccineum]
MWGKMWSNAGSGGVRRRGGVGAGGGEVKGGGIDFGVSKSLLGEIHGVVISEGGGELFGDDGGAVGDLLNGDVPFLDIVTKEVMTDFDMFGTRMENGIFA